ncbi:MAG: hypothetical protein D6731_03415 [Planctomycetota bacterium]|nr:MAG: hypothetical protein D6731_03415 [Planctomycetota bacterium]
MERSLTLSAVCEVCAERQEVAAEDLFDFDCACPTCGGLLVLEEEDEGQGQPSTGVLAPSSEDERQAAGVPLPQPSALDSESLPRELLETREDTREGDPAVEDAGEGADRRTKADTEDPYEQAAFALDPEGTARIRRPRAALPLEGAVAKPLAEEGTLASSEPPLPAWDGGDTQVVRELADGEPATAALPPAVDLGGRSLREVAAESEGVDPSAAEDIASLDPSLEVLELRGSTAGRGSRTYEPEQLAANLEDAGPARPPIPDATLHPPAPGRRGTNGSARTEEGDALFGQDLDWLALIEDRLPEGEGDAPGDDAGRVVITLSEDAAPSEDRLKETIQQLDAGGGLDLLILGGLPGGAQATVGEKTAAPDDAEDSSEPTDPTAREQDGNAADEASAPSEGQPTLSHQRLDTKAWEKAFAEQEQERQEDPRAELEDGPTRPWPDAGSPKSEAPAAWENAEDEPTRAWEQRRPAPSGKEEVDTRDWKPGADAPEPAPSPSRPPPRGSSARHRRRQGDGARSIEKFRRESLDAALVCATDVSSPEADGFRQLHQQIFRARNGHSPRTVLVTSARRGEGKTTVAANLAIAGARVPGSGAVLVDADPRGRGVLAAFGERSPMEGLLEALETGKPPHEVVVQFPLGNMDVVPLGIRGSNAAELIASDRMGEFLRSLTTLYPRWPIVIDGSAVLRSGADPLTLSELVEGVVLVVRAGRATEDEVSRVADMIGRERLLGVVLNDAEE